MLRSLPESLLGYTCEGVVIRARYIRQLDSQHKIIQSSKHIAKKIISDAQKQCEQQREIAKKQAYAEGLKALFSDLLCCVIQYQKNIANYEIQQRELISEVVANYFQSPQMQVELIQRLIKESPTENKLTITIPQTLQSYLEKTLDDQNIEIIPHDNTLISVTAGSQILVFDPKLFIQDLKTQFHRPYSDQHNMAFNDEIKNCLIDYIQKFEVDDVDSKNTDSLVSNGENNEY